MSEIKPPRSASNGTQVPQRPWAFDLLRKHVFWELNVLGGLEL